MGVLLEQCDLHARLGHADLFAADPAIGLGDRAHDREGRGEERGLHALAIAGLEAFRSWQRFHALVEVVAECRAEQGAERQELLLLHDPEELDLEIG